jgi:hypothetical protein
MEKEIKPSGADLDIGEKIRMYNKLEGVRTSQSEVDAERWQEKLDATSEKLTPADIVAEKNRLESSEDPKDREAASMLNYLQNYLALSDKKAFIRRMAKRYVWELSNAAKAVINQDVSHALEMLANAAYATAELEFPAELKQQDALREEDNKDMIEAAKKRLDRLNVS